MSDSAMSSTGFGLIAADFVIRDRPPLVLRRVEHFDERTEAQIEILVRGVLCSFICHFMLLS